MDSSSSSSVKWGVGERDISHKAPSIGELKDLQPSNKTRGVIKPSPAFLVIYNEA